MEHLNAIIEEAAGAVRSGEVIGVPTDTLYGLAADPYDQNALARIFEIKGRPGVKPLASTRHSRSPRFPTGRWISPRSTGPVR